MTDEKISQRLLALASAEDRKIFTRIRGLFPEIEAAITAGVKRSKIVQVLNEEGIPISAEVFTTYVSRLRFRDAVAADRNSRQSDKAADSSGSTTTGITVTNQHQKHSKTHKHKQLA